MAARSKARKRALDLIYASEMRHRSAVEALAEQTADGTAHNEYTVQLVEGITEHLARLDEVIASYAKGWTLSRMPAVDRNVLRIGVFELLYVEDVPDAVAVTEAMNLVRDLSTDESPAFVNGILGSILRNKASLA